MTSFSASVGKTAPNGSEERRQTQATNFNPGKMNLKSIARFILEKHFIATQGQNRD